MTSDLGAVLAGAPDVAVHLGPVETRRDELVVRADDVAAALRSRGVEPGHAVAVMLPNSATTIATLFGVWRAGAAYTPFNPRSTEIERAHNLDAIRPAAMITSDGIETLDAPRRCDLDTALIQFTSGTTGPPKPVPLRHGTVLDLLDRVVASIRGGDSGRAGAGGEVRAPMPNLVPVSLSLWAGIYQVLFAFRVGAPVVLMDRFETKEFRALVAQFGIRSTVLPPAAMTMLTDDPEVTDLAPLRMIRSITAPLSPVQARRFRDRFGVVVLNSYGQTELGGEVVGWNAADVRAHGETKLGSVGRPHQGVEVRADEHELHVRTPATANRQIGAEFVDRLTDDGWFRTGDLGRVDDDGFVWIDGRASEMINRGGLKVFPGDVEEVLLSAPSVRDVAVVGVADDRLGEVPWAFVVPAGDHVDETSLLEWCRTQLSPYKVPVRITEVAELPRNEVGKVLKHRLLATDRANE